MIENALIVLNKIKEIEKNNNIVKTKYEPFLKDLSNMTKTQGILESLVGKTKTTPIIKFFISPKEEEKDIVKLKDYLESKNYYITLRKEIREKEFEEKEEAYVMRVYLEGE